MFWNQNPFGTIANGALSNISYFPNFPPILVVNCSCEFVQGYGGDCILQRLAGPIFIFKSSNQDRCHVFFFFFSAGLFYCKGPGARTLSPAINPYRHCKFSTKLCFHRSVYVKRNKRRDTAAATLLPLLFFNIYISDYATATWRLIIFLCIRTRDDSTVGVVRERSEKGKRKNVHSFYLAVWRYIYVKKTSYTFFFFF